MKTVKIFSLVSLITFLLLIMTSCSKEVIKKKTLSENRSKWEQVNTGDYEFDYNVGCFCAFSGNARVVVKSDTLHDVLDPDTGLPLLISVDSLPVLELYPNSFYTVDEMLDRIQVERRESHTVDVTFDEENGYPTSVFFDQIKNAVDDEMSFSFKNLEFGG